MANYTPVQIRQYRILLISDIYLLRYGGGALSLIVAGFFTLRQTVVHFAPLEEFESGAILVL
jgi:hypothetical protein